MEPIKLNIVKNSEDLKNPGDASPYMGIHSKTGERILQLGIICPGCREESGSAGNHVYNPKTETYHPSIVHDKELGGCGWHGWLKNGFFTEC